MESKFIVMLFVLATSTTQSSYAQDESTIYGLSEQDTAQFYKIIENYNTTISATLNAVNLLFDVLEILSTEREYELQCEAFDYSTLVDGALENGKIATDSTFDSIKVIVQNCFTLDENATTTAHGDLENVYNEQIKNAIQLASSGNSTDIKTQFEPFASVTKSSFETFITRIFDTIRTCVNTTDTKTLAAIKVREIEATSNIADVYAAFFDALKLFASGTSYTESTSDVINYYRQRANLHMKNSVLNIFSTMRGMFVSTQLDQPKLAASLISDQYVQSLSQINYQATVDLMFGVMKEYLIKLKLGLSEGCDDDSTPLDAAQARTAQHFKNGLHSLAEFVPTKNPITSALVKAALNLFSTFTDDANAGYYNGIRFARGGNGSTYSQSLAKIHAIEARVDTELPKFYGGISGLVKFGSTNRNESTGFSNNLNNAARSWLDNIFGAIHLLAKVCHGEKALTEEDFGAMETFTNEASSASKNFTMSISSSHVLVVKKLNRILSIIPTVSSAVVPTPARVKSRLDSIFG